MMCRAPTIYTGDLQIYTRASPVNLADTINIINADLDKI